MDKKQGLFPDAIYVNGKVLALDDQSSRAEAPATMADKIVALGPRPPSRSWLAWQPKS